MQTGPTKVIVKNHGLYDAATNRLIRDGLATRKDMEDYAAHHYLALPMVDRGGRAWAFDGSPVYCFHGTQYETLREPLPHVRPCPECGGMAIRMEEATVEWDCVRCTQCGVEFEPRLEMMES
jgi:hypothetical protein